MNIKSIKLDKHIVPEGSCGTGYSCPDKFTITTSDGNSSTLYIDIWYKDKDSIKREFNHQLIKTFGITNIDNWDEAFKMYAQEVANITCPYSFEELTKDLPNLFSMEE